MRVGIVLFCLIFYMLNSALSSDQNNVLVKIMNHTPHGMSVSIAGEGIVLGVGNNPVVFLKVPHSEITIIEFSERDDEEIIKLASVALAADRIGKGIGHGSRFFNTLSRLAFVEGKIDKVIDKMETIVEASSNIASAATVAQVQAKLRKIENLSDISKGISNGMNLSLMDLGIGAIDWLCQEGRARGSLRLIPNEINNFAPGNMLVLDITSNGPQISICPISQQPPMISCVIESHSTYPLLCIYTDAQGHRAQVRLHKSLPSAIIDVLVDQPNIEIGEFVPYDKSATHHSFQMAKGLISANLAVVDPFPISKALSAYSAVTSIYQAGSGIWERTFADRKAIICIQRDEIYTIVDDPNNWACIVVQVKRTR